MTGRHALAMWPVAAIEGAIADLLGRPTGPNAGALRARIRVALGCLRPGAIDDATDARWKAQVPGVMQGELLLDLDRARRPPDPTPGQGYLLSIVGGRGCVADATVHQLGAHEAPTHPFWPEGARAAVSVEGAARDAHARAAACLTFPVVAPLIGWHWLELSLPERYELSDRSCTAALALLLLSRWLGKALDPSVAVTGDLTSDGELWLPPEAARAVRRKADAVASERKCVRRLLVPPGFAWEDPRLEIEEVRTLPDLARRVGLDLAAPAPAPFELHGWLQAITQCESMALVRAATVEALRGRLELLEAAYPRLQRPAGAGADATAVVAARVRLLTRLCEYQTHAAAIDAAVRTHEILDQLLRAHDVDLPRGHVASARNAAASVLIDVHRFQTAARLVDEAAGAAEDARDWLERARIESTRGRIAAHGGRHDDALAALDEALRRFAKVAPWEANIARSYRIDQLARLGRGPEAWAALDEARAVNAPDHAVPAGWRADNDIYLAYQAMKVALLTGEPARGVEAGARAVELARERLPSAWPATGIFARAVELALGLGDRETASGHLTELERVCASAPAGVAVNALGRAAAAWIVRDVPEGRPSAASAIDRVAGWLAALPDGEASPFREPRDVARAALERGDPAALVAPLRALLWRDCY